MRRVRQRYQDCGAEWKDTKHSSALCISGFFRLTSSDFKADVLHGRVRWPNACRCSACQRTLVECGGCFDIARSHKVAVKLPQDCRIHPQPHPQGKLTPGLTHCLVYLSTHQLVNLLFHQRVNMSTSLEATHIAVDASTSQDVIHALVSRYWCIGIKICCFVLLERKKDRNMSTDSRINILTFWWVG